MDEPSDGYAKTIVLLLLHLLLSMMKNYKSDKYQRHGASGGFAGDEYISGQ